MTLGYLVKRLSLIAATHPELARRRIIKSEGVGADLGAGRELVLLLLHMAQYDEDHGPPTIHIVDSQLSEEIRRGYYQEAGGEESDETNFQGEDWSPPGYNG